VEKLLTGKALNINLIDGSNEEVNPPPTPAPGPEVD
jgi:hypothetical protein